MWGIALMSTDQSYEDLMGEALGDSVVAIPTQLDGQQRTAYAALAGVQDAWF